MQTQVSTKTQKVFYMTKEESIEKPDCESCNNSRIVNDPFSTGDWGYSERECCLDFCEFE